MARQRSTKPHLTNKPRPQAPPKKATPTPWQPNLTPEETARRSNLTPGERSAEARQAELDAQHMWWTGEKWVPRGTPKPTASSSSTSSAPKAKAEKEQQEAEEKEYGSFFHSPSAESADEEEEEVRQEKQPKPKPQPSSGSASTFYSTESPQARDARNARKVARSFLRQEQKRAEKKKAQGEARARREHQRQEDFEFSSSTSSNNDEYWTSLLNSQDKDKEEFGVYYTTLTLSLRAFKISTSSPFPTINNFTCKRNNCLRGEKIGACHHDLEKVLRGGGQFSKEWLRKERLSWHPDKFSGAGERLEHARTCAAVVFKMFQRLLEGEKQEWRLQD